MIELKIKFDGDFPGLSEGRLSVDTFGQPLTQLLVATRRIATAIVTDAVDDSERGAGGGRLAKKAELLDLQIEKIDGGSLVLTLALWMLTQARSQGTLFEELPERTGRVLIEALRDESSGRQRNARVRTYLESLPKTVTSQAYSLQKDGATVDEVTIGAVTLAEIPPELPYAVRVEGQIIGVGFEPGKNEVRLKLSGGVSVFSATSEQVESALRLRTAGAVRVMAVTIDSKARLLSMTTVTEAERTPTPEELQGLVFDKWDDLLRRLA